MGGKSKSDSSQKTTQTTTVDEDTLTSIGSSGDVIKGQQVTISSGLDENELSVFDTLADFAKDSLTAVTTSTEKVMSGYQGVVDDVKDIQIQQSNPETSTTKIIGMTAVGLGAMYALSKIITK